MRLSSFTQSTDRGFRLALLALAVSAVGGLQAKGKWYVSDPLGNTLASVNADAVVAEVESTALGESRTPTAGERFTGKPYDADLDAHVFPFRNYRSDAGRWTSADPSGFPDGVNGVVYAPNPLSGLDPTGLLSIVANSSQAGWINNSGIRMDGFFWDAKTSKGNQFQVFQVVSVQNPPPAPPVPLLQNDFTMNCHGYVYLPGYWVNDPDVATILADEWKETDEKHATIVVYGGGAHSVKVTGRDPSGSITGVTGKNGYQPVITTALNGTGYSGPKFYE